MQSENGIPIERHLSTVCCRPRQTCTFMIITNRLRSITMRDGKRIWSRQKNLLRMVRSLFVEPNGNKVNAAFSEKFRSVLRKTDNGGRTAEEFYYAKLAFLEEEVTPTLSGNVRMWLVFCRICSAIACVF